MTGLAALAVGALLAGNGGPGVSPLAVGQGPMAFTQDIVKAGKFKAGDPLEPTSTATTVHVRNGKTVTTDGPFAETKEQLGGYYLVEAKDSTRRYRSPRESPPPGPVRWKCGRFAR